MDSIKVFSVYNLKGGVGKTTFTSALAYELAKFGKTLIIDADEQANLTDIYIKKFAEEVSPEEKRDIQSVFMGETELEKAIWEVKPDLWLLPMHFTRKPGWNIYLKAYFPEDRDKIRDIINQAVSLGFQYLMVDLPPTMTDFNMCTLKESTEIIPITTMEQFSIKEYLKLIKETIKEMNRRYNKNILVRNVIINDLETQNKKQMQWLEKFKASPFKIYEIQHSQALPNATAAHMPIQEYDKANKMNKIIEKLALEIK